MKITRIGNSIRKTLFLFVLILLAVAGFIRFGASASSGGQNDSPDSIKLISQNSPAINLRPGRDLATVYRSADYSSEQLRSGQNQPLALASNDFDVDGFPDLVTVYAAANGGVLTFHKGNSEAFAPQSEESRALLGEGRFPEPFLADAESFNVPSAPDFLATGDFDRDGNLDVITATRGGSQIFFLAGKGKLDGFDAARQIDLAGTITALKAGEIDVSDNRADLLVGIETGAGASLLVFENAESGIFGAAAKYQLDAPAVAFDLGKLDDDMFADAAILTGAGVSILHGRGRDAKTIFDVSRLEKIDLPFAPQALVVGDFIADRAGKMEMALLAADGTVRTARRGELDERPFSIREAQANRAAQFIAKQNGKTMGQQKMWKTSASENWTIDDSANVAVSESRQPDNNAAPILLKANLSGSNTDDILFLNAATREIKILSSPEPEKSGDEIISFGSGVRSVYTLEAENRPMAMLAARLNIFARPGLIVLQNGKIEPTFIAAAPTATFTVTKTADTGDGVCGGDCSLREAITAANAAAGADIITLPAGTYTLTITNTGANEDNNSTGDLDINQDLTINGAGQATTIIQGGTTNTNGIDKVFASNPFCTSVVNTSFSGITVRYGRNTQPGNAADFSYTGGGMDWCNPNANGTLMVTNSTYDDNFVGNGLGGGISLATASSTSGAVTMTGVTISNNESGNPTFTTYTGGGMAVTGGVYNLTITNSTFTGNVARTGEGGGLLIVHALTSNDNSVFQLNNLTFTNNSAAAPGGGIFYSGVGSNSFTLQDSSFDNNISGTVAGKAARGGGLLIESRSQPSYTGNATVTRSTIINNKLSPNGTNQGGAGIGVNQGPLTLSYCRIVNNSGTNLGTGLNKNVNSGATTAINNWWGCSTGPSAAPCDTAVLTAGSAGSLNFNPWIVLRHTASPSTITVGQNSTLTASFLTNSNGNALNVADIVELIGLPVTFNNPVRGTISNAQATIQSNGTATATFTGTSAGAASADAIVDNDVAAAGRTNRATLTVNQAGTTTAVTSSLNPSRVGQSVTFTATVSPVSPATGTPTGTIQFVVDGNNFGSPVALSGGTAMSAATTTLTAGNHTVTAVYSGDTNYASSGSLAGGQVVIAPPTISKSFGATSVVINNSTSLSFTITNPAANTVSLTGVSFTDSLPAGLVVATPNGLTGSCGGGAITAVAGSGTVSLSGATLGTSANCTFSVNVTGTTLGTKTNSVTVNSTNGGMGNTSTASVTVIGQPDLTITKTHTGNFSQGQTGAQYTITVTNSGTSAVVAGNTVTVTDTLPTGLTATAISGAGWNCTLATLTCTRSDALAVSASYPAITLTVNVANNAPSSVTNRATVSGGGEANTTNNIADDATTINIATAAPVEVGGQITTQSGQGLNGAQVTIIDRLGGSRTIVTNDSGYFKFTNVPSGETYIISASLGDYYFAPRILNITEDVTDLRIAAQ